MKQTLLFMLLLAIAICPAVFADDATENDDGPVITEFRVLPEVPGDFDEDAGVEDVQEEELLTDMDEPGKPGKPRINYGLMLGVYNPMNSEVRDVFGGNFVRYGLRRMPSKVPQNWQPTFDISYYGMSRFNDSATLMPITGGLIRGFNRATDDLQSYLALNAGPYYGSVYVPRMGIDHKGWGLSGNACVGLMYQERFFIEGRYEITDRFAGFDFSSFTISAAVKLFDARF